MARPSIYDQHDKAFHHVSAYVVLEGWERLATIAIKFPKDDADRLWAYVQWSGTEMTRGYADGYGYDKQTAAIKSAVARLAASPTEASPARRAAFQAALSNCGGHEWDRRLRDAGFDIWQAV